MVSYGHLLLILFLSTKLVTSQWSDYRGPHFNCTFNIYGINLLPGREGVNIDSGSCSITTFDGEIPGRYDVNEVSLSCEGTSKVTLKVRYFHYFGYTLKCSAPFPLDVDLDIPMPPDADVDYQKIGETFTTTFNDSRKNIDRIPDMAGNFTYLSTHNLSHKITIALSLTSTILSRGLIEEPPIEITRRDIERVPRIWCSYRYAATNTAMTVGANPTLTQLLTRCLKPESSYCSADIRRDKYFENASPDSIKHGVLLCSVHYIQETMNYFSPVSSCDTLEISLIWHDENVIRIQKDDLEPHLVVPRVYSPAVSVNTVTIYDRDFVRLECHFLRYAIGQHPISWVIKYQNGTDHSFTSGEETREEKYCENENGTILHSSILENSSHVQIQGRAGMIAVECQANYWNFNKTAKATLNITIKDLSEATAPWFLKEETEFETDLGRSHQLQCVADDADPMPQYSWEFVALNPPKSNTNLSLSILDAQESIFRNGSWGSMLSLPPFVPSMDGQYICSAKNVRGNATRTFKVTLHKEQATSVWVYIGIAVGITAVVGISAIGCSRKYFLKKGRLTATEIMLFEKGDAKQFRSDQFAHENAQFMPYNRGFEIKWSDFKIFDEAKLGQGEYGIVFKGCFIRNPSHTIAVKTVKPGAERIAILALLSELKVMIHLESHENVVKLLGACTEFLKEGRLYVIVEYCPLGSMDSYLRRLDKKQFAEMHLSSNCNKTIEESNLNYESVNYLCTQDLVGWAIQIARGMQHLESKKVIHGDLATRNVLLYSKAHVKITDFGLSRQLLNYENYVKKSQTKLPWRWLALETLKSLTFSHKSDVWAYGVTLWEIFTLGLIPYPGMNWTTEFVLYLEDNLRLYQPKFATDNMYKIMMRCWDAEPDNRPDFQQLEQSLFTLSE